MRRTRVLVGGLAGLVLLAAMPAAAGAAVARDRLAGIGHGRVFPPGGIDFFVHVNAKSGPLGEEPKGHFFFRSDPELGEGFDTRGHVTCLRVVGNFATVGGAVERSKTPSAAVGEGVFIAVHDSTDPERADAFVFGFFESPPSATECPDPQPFFRSFALSLQDGDFRVQDAEP